MMAEREEAGRDPLLLLPDVAVRLVVARLSLADRARASLVARHWAVLLRTALALPGPLTLVVAAPTHPQRAPQPSLLVPARGSRRWAVVVRGWRAWAPVLVRLRLVVTGGDLDRLAAALDLLHWLPGVRWLGATLSHLPYSDVQALQHFPPLADLSLVRCGRLASADAVGAHAATLTRLQVRWCSHPAFTGLGQLAALTALVALEVVSSSPALPPLAPLPALRSLLLVYGAGQCVDGLACVAGCTGLTGLAVTGAGLDGGLGVLLGLQRLQRLQLAACPGLADVDVLARLPALTELTLHSCGALRELPGLSRLVEADVAHCTALTGLGGLGASPGLRRVQLTGCFSLTSLAFLAASPGLTQLAVAECCQLQDADAVWASPALASLALAHCHHLQFPLPVGPSGLATSLVCLEIDGARQLHDLGFVAHLPALRCVAVRNCPSLARLGSAPQLTELQLSHYRGADLAGLQGCRGLAVLWVEHSTVAGLEALAHCALQRLVLADCHSLAHLDGLAGCSQLSALTVESCSALACVDGLAGPAATLWDLALRYCTRLQDLGALGACTGLTSLQLVDTGATCLAALATCTALRALRLQLFATPSLRPLAPLQALTALTLNLAGPSADLAPLALCPLLARLDLALPAGTDLSGLAGCMALSHLTIDGQQLPDSLPEGTRALLQR